AAPLHELVELQALRRVDQGERRAAAGASLPDPLRGEPAAPVAAGEHARAELLLRRRDHRGGRGAMTGRRTLGCAALAACAAAAPAPSSPRAAGPGPGGGGAVEGAVHVREQGLFGMSDRADRSGVVVYLEGVPGEPARRREAAELRQRERRFVPGVLA